MFQLRRLQLDVCAGAAEPAFEKAVMSHLREHHSSALNNAPDAILQKRVRFGLARARRHGLSLQNDLTAFVVYMFQIAPNFDEHPPIRNVLSDATAEPDSRMDLLLERVTGQDWVDAKRLGDPNLWEQAIV